MGFLYETYSFGFTVFDCSFDGAGLQDCDCGADSLTCVGTFAIGFAWKSGETGGHCGSEPRPCGRGQKDGGCGLAVLQRLQEDARPGEAGYRLGVRRKQPASGDCRGMRATPDQCDV